MKAIKLRVHVPVSVAVKAGVGLAGESLVDLSTEILSCLSQEDRETLSAEMRQGDGGYGVPYALELSSPEITPTSVMAALKAHLEKTRNLKAQAQAECDERVRKALALPDDNWVGLFGHRGDYFDTRFPGSYGDDTSCSKALRGAIQARRESLAPLVAKKNSELEEEKKASNARAEKAQEEKAVEDANRKALRVKAFKNYALETDEISRAAKEGYDIVGAVMDHVAQDIASFGECETDVEDSATWENWSSEERSAPSTASLDLRDRIVAHVNGVRRPAEGCEITVSRVARVEEDDEKYTGVVVYVDSPIAKQRAVIFRAE